VELPPGLDAVYREHLDFVVRIARQLGAGPETVEDVVHDVFLIVHRRLHEFDGRSMRSRLYGITRRVLAHERRGSERARLRLAKLPPPAAPPDPEATAAAAQAIDLVESFLASLDEDQRVVFSLVEIEGCSAVEVAQSLGVNLNTIYSRLRIARQRFARAVAAIGGTDHG
jgi:RNA polymerase sigma-70 factor (ECF subfamily)